MPVTTPAYQATGTAQSSTAALNTAGGRAVAWPTHQTGDVGLLVVETEGGQPASLTTASGFVAVANSPVATGSGTSGTQLTVYWCRATSNAMANVEVADAGQHTTALIFTFRGCAATGTPYDTTVDGTNTQNPGTAVNATASTSPSWPAITTGKANELLVYLITQDLGTNPAFLSAETNANLTGIAERFDAGFIAGNGGGIAMWTGLKATAGDAGAGTATATSSIHAMMVLALLGETAPSTTLDTADATAMTNSQPTVEFHGTDSEGADCTYRVAIDNALDRVGHLLAGTDTPLAVMQGGSGATGEAQSFIAPSSVPLTAATFWLAKLASPTGNIVANLYAHSGTLGTSSVPTGSALATSDPVDITTLSTSYGLISFTFSTPYTLAAGTNYCIAIEFTGTSGNALLPAGYTTATIANHAGNASTLTLGAWAAAASQDMIFYLWTTGPQVLLDKASATDAGFVDHTNGGDTDPFASGDHIYYTVQSANALPEGSYTWWAIANDPSGSATWGQLPTARTFTTKGPVTATASGTAYNAYANVQPNAGLAAAAGVAENAEARGGIGYGLATGVADNAYTNIRPNAGAATATGTAYAATALSVPNAIPVAAETDTAFALTGYKVFGAEVSLTNPDSDDVVMSAVLTASKTEAGDSGDIRISVVDGTTVIATSAWVALTTTPTVQTVTVTPPAYVADLRVRWEVRTDFSVDVVVSDVSALSMSVAVTAAASGTAYNASVAIRTNAGIATASGTANQALTNVRPNAGVATGAGTGFDPSAHVAPTPITANAAGFADNATAHGAPNEFANADLAAAAGTAYNATVSISPKAGLAAASGVANNATVSIVANAGLATGVGVAFTSPALIAPNAGTATGTGIGNDATVTTTGGSGPSTDADAGAATAVGEAFQPSVSIRVNAAVALAHGVAYTMGRAGTPATATISVSLQMTATLTAGGQMTAEVS